MFHLLSGSTGGDSQAGRLGIDSDDSDSDDMSLDVDAVLSSSSNALQPKGKVRAGFWPGLESELCPLFVLTHFMGDQAKYLLFESWELVARADNLCAACWLWKWQGLQAPGIGGIIMDPGGDDCRITHDTAIVTGSGCGAC